MRGSAAGSIAGMGCGLVKIKAGVEEIDWRMGLEIYKATLKHPLQLNCFCRCSGLQSCH